MYSDTSGHQLGAVTMQDRKPLAFIRESLTKHKSGIQPKRELLSAIETCKENNNILLAYPIIVFTDHKNNVFTRLKAHASDRVLRWFLLLEEFGVTFEYLPGNKQRNVVADSLFRLYIYSLKIQENIDEALTLLSGSENSSTSNIKSTILIHYALIFNEQAN
jgi:hypothetical protein